LRLWRGASASILKPGRGGAMPVTPRAACAQPARGACMISTTLRRMRGRPVSQLRAGNSRDGWSRSLFGFLV